jgi:hypothetical protein
MKGSARSPSLHTKEEGIPMRKILAGCLAAAGLLAFAANIHAQQEHRDLSRESKLFRNYTGEGSTSVTSLCMEGYVFVLVNGNISNQTSITQVYEEKNGKIIPKRCDQ